MGADERLRELRRRALAGDESALSELEECWRAAAEVVAAPAVVKPTGCCDRMTEALTAAFEAGEDFPANPSETAWGFCPWCGAR